MDYGNTFEESVQLVNTRMREICDNMRNITGNTEPLNLQDMASEVNKVYDAGVELGKSAGQSEFWDNFQNHGELADYDYAFSNGNPSVPYPWNEHTFKPKYQIKPTSAVQMFYQSAVKDCQAILDIDFSQCTSLTQMCETMYDGITHLGVIDARNATSLNQMVKNSRSVKTIDKLILKDDGSQTMTQFANLAYGLENITIEGVIGSSSHFNGGALTHDSLMSIINALKDYAGSGKTYTLTLAKTHLNKLTDEEKAIATQKGWTLA